MKIKISGKILVLILIGFLSLGYFVFFKGNKNGKVQAREIVVYKEPTCQCCEFWAYYTRKNGYKVKIINVDDIEAIKKKYNIPPSLWACHTAISKEGYVFEGHLPVEAIEKFYKEKSSGSKAKGIALPGMPTGVPGMGGFKKGILSVFEFDKKGRASEFYRF